MHTISNNFSRVPKYKKTIFALLVIAQTIIISYLLINVYLKNSKLSKVLGLSINPIKQEYIKVGDESLKYYFEYIPGITVPEERAWLQRTTHYSISKDTLNERFDYNPTKPDNVFRIITLGDSFTFGQLVDTRNNWPEKLEDILNLGDNSICKTRKFEVINLGMPNYGVEYIAHRYEKRGKIYNPDLIIWLETGTGFDRINEILLPLMKKYENILPENERVKAENEGFSLVYKSANEEMLKQYSYEQLSEMAKISWQDFFRTRGDVLTVIVMFEDLPNFQKFQLKNWSKNQNNLLFFDNASSVNIEDRALKDGHPSESGHLSIASDIFNFLKDRGVIPCFR